MTDTIEPIRVAILDNSIDPEVYQPVVHWTRWLPSACPWEAFTARERRFPPDLRRFTHVILTGSEASILEPEPWVFEEAEIVEKAVGLGLSVLGSCWGHQLLACVLAGPESVGRCARPEIGWITVRMTAESGLLGPENETADVFSSHFDEVRDPGKPFRILASSEDCAVQAMQFDGCPVWGLQGHPEVDIPTGLKFLGDLVDRGFKGREFLLKAIASVPRDSGLIRRIVPEFLRRKGSRED